MGLDTDGRKMGEFFFPHVRAPRVPGMWDAGRVVRQGEPFSGQL